MTSQYPAISHSFIQREVEALRARGLEIQTFAIHRGHEQLRSDADREAALSTFALVPGRWLDFMRAHVRVLLGRPGSYFRTLIVALRGPSGGSRGRLSQLAYFGGAVVVWDQCRRRGLRHVHAHFTSPAADVARLVARLGDRRGDRTWSWSFTAHGTDILNDSPARLAEKVRDASLVVCVSEFGRSRLMALVEEIHWPKLQLVRCGLDAGWLARPGRNGAPARRRDPAALRLLSVGRVEREKGHVILLEAIAELKRRGLAVSLELIGDGSLLGSLRRTATELGVGESVTFAGSMGQDRIRDSYPDSDVFCLPSLGEGVPVVLMEAMAAGVPVVASGIMGVPELVEDGVSGLLVRPGRPEPLANAIQTLAADPELRQRMGEAGRRRVAEGFSLEASADRLVLLFAELLDGSDSQTNGSFDDELGRAERRGPEPIPR